MQNNDRIRYLALVLLICCYWTYDLQAQNLIQNVGAREKMSLDGLWEAIVDPLENGLYNHSLGLRKNGYFLNEQMKNSYDLIEYDFDHSYRLNVPGDWNTQMEKLYYYEGTIWYKKTFQKPERDGRKVLYFEGVNYQCKVYLNGELLGDHVGGFSPFSFDVTDKLKDSNHLILKVDNKRLREAVPTINFDWWNYGGITRSVAMIFLDDSYIEDYSLQLDEEGRIEGWAKLKGDNIANREVSLEIDELKTDLLLRTDQDGYAKFNIKAKPVLWTPDNPKRYRVTLGLEGVTFEDQIGFKTIETDGSQILLNGEPIFLRGISMHEEAPFGGGRVTTPEQARVLLSWVKELGCNFIRLAHYPHNEFTVKIAEEMGLLVWSEIPVYWTIDYDNPSTYQNAEQQLQDMISRDKNRVGIALWSVANETPVTESRLTFLRRLIDQVKMLDDTRLITAALNIQSSEGNKTVIDDPLGEYIDVIGINSYCGWYGGRPYECGDKVWDNPYNKPMIMSEVGGGALAGMRGTVDERWTEDYQAEVYKYNLEMLDKIDFLAGVSPWLLMDFRSPRRNLRHIQKDYNRKGIISEKGIRKKAFYVLQEYYDQKKKSSK
ncbi:MAG: glycoside hydrolase family 2 TIM barrel-domain containing protein [Cyclobacteriaceae bacterium]